MKGIRPAWLCGSPSRVSGRSHSSAISPVVRKVQDGAVGQLKLWKPVTEVSNYCATGTDAFRCGVMAIACGLYDTVLVVGYDKPKDRGVSGPSVMMDGVRDLPKTPAGWFSLCAATYFDKYGAGREDLARIAVKNHHNGTLAPNSFLKREISLDDYMKARMISWPFGLYDCAAQTDGAAAVIVTSRPQAVRMALLRHSHHEPERIARGRPAVDGNAATDDGALAFRLNATTQGTDNYRDVETEFARASELVGDDVEVQRWNEVDTYLGTMMKVMDGFVLIWVVVIFLALSFGLVNTLVMAVFFWLLDSGLLWLTRQFVG